MDQLFLQIINMNITASYVILFVIVVRLLIRKCPKTFSYVLWLVVLFRLICPFTIEGIYSLIPMNHQAIKSDIIYSKNPQINTAIKSVDSTVNDSLPAPNSPTESVNPIQIWLAIGEIVWVTGIILLLAYCIYTTIQLYRKLKFAIHVSGNVYMIQGIKTPFAFGMIKPKIYLPIHLSDKEQEYILLHEQKHISRLDHMIKALAFLLVCVHWFNPLVWIAFFLMGEDMELSCDESVIKQLGNNIKKEYSSSLLSLSTGRRIVGGSPLAFGENNTKGRIKNVLKYKKPTFWMIIVSVIVVIVIGIGLIANPKKTEADLSFLNPEQLANVLFQEESRDIKIADYPRNGYIQFKPSNVAQWIMDTEWEEKKVDLPYEQPVTYAILNAYSEDTKSEIRFFESDPTLVIVVYEDTWRYYTISKESYDDFVFMLLLSSSFIPFENETIDTSIVNENITIAIEMDELLTAHFDSIMNTPITYSNPYDYIKANQSIFDEIVSYGNSALIYCFNLFEQGGQNDLKGHLMLHVCTAIQPESRHDIGYETGQLWYDEFKKRAYELKETYSMEELEKHYPTYYLLLELLSEGFEGSTNEMRVPNFSYRDTDEILKLVYDTETDKRYLKEDGFLIPAVHIHGSYEEENKLKVFATIYHKTYKLYGDKVKSVGGGVIPVAITYTKDVNGNYMLEDYVQSGDGSEFGPSIKEFCTYPTSGKEISGLADRIMSHYSDCEDLHQLQRSNLIEHLNRYNLTGISMITDYDDSVVLLN